MSHLSSRISADNTKYCIIHDCRFSCMQSKENFSLKTVNEESNCRHTCSFYFLYTFTYFYSIDRCHRRMSTIFLLTRQVIQKNKRDNEREQQPFSVYFDYAKMLYALLIANETAKHLMLSIKRRKNGNIIQLSIQLWLFSISSLLVYVRQHNTNI